MQAPDYGSIAVGRIVAEGTVDEPIVFQGDRLEDAFDEIPGQWDRIWVNQSKNGDPQIFKHCIIKNNFLGIQAEPLVLNENDALSPGANNRLDLSHTVVKNNSGASLLIRNYNIDAENCPVCECWAIQLCDNGRRRI